MFRPNLKLPFLLFPKKESMTSLFLPQKIICTCHQKMDAWQKHPSMKIQSRLDYFFVPKFLQTLIQECRIIPNTFSDHSALILTICFNEETVPRGPGNWRFNNSLLSDNEYIALLHSKIPKFGEKYRGRRQRSVLGNGQDGDQRFDSSVF